MHKIAFIIGERFVYWTPIMLAFGLAAAVCMFLAIHLGHTGKATCAFLAVPLSIILALVFGRLVYWFCVPTGYNSIVLALTDFGTEGFALAGIVVGCVLSAGLMRLVGLCDDLPAMLDSMSLAGLFGLAVGRLNHFFNEGGLSAAAERQIPVFVYQALSCAALFVGLLIFFLILGRKRAGDTCLFACLLYGMTQVLLGGLRADALVLPFGGGLALAQISGYALVMLAVVATMVKLFGNQGFKWWYLCLWIPLAGGIVWVGILINDLRSNIIADPTALLMLAAVVVLTLVNYVLGFIKKRTARFLRTE